MEGKLILGQLNPNYLKKLQTSIKLYNKITKIVEVETSITEIEDREIVKEKIKISKVVETVNIIVVVEVEVEIETVKEISQIAIRNLKMKLTTRVKLKEVWEVLIIVLCQSILKVVAVKKATILKI